MSAQGSSLDRAYLGLGERLGESLEREMLAGDALAPHLTAALWVAMAIATLTYLMAIALVAGGAVVIVVGEPRVWPIVLGTVLVASGVVTCPRPFRRARVSGSGVSSATLPVLHEVIGRVAGALEVAPPDVVLFDTRYNASWSHDGLRRRRVLRLGVPLVAFLDPQQLVALLAHELAHDRNGDARRGLLVGSSVQCIASMLDALSPTRIPGQRGLAVLGALMSNAVLWCCRQPVRGLLVLQIHLLYRDSQRAEFLADDLAATVAGSAAVVGVLDAFLARGPVEVVIRRATLSGDQEEGEVLDAIAAAAARVDDATRRSQRERARGERRRLASTHPTTAGRISVLEHRADREGSVVLSDPERTALASELHACLSGYVARLLDRDHERLYFG